ncbi:unnamed protein product [Acanthoscelides obtectus]|uniref:Uncharacterized protein n=1 Tax=Acanthoscelides obtectus TaxID=200917 RepID=A0A9P0L257_ACAOB|nr:unnamed protein product [Acanthoscelides obtectus]CAK1631223.1 hypothetical protein AOBTE_LOCUS6822 [Acanthoscelides obtectus]
MDYSYKLQHNIAFTTADQRHALDTGDELETDDETHNQSKSSSPIRSAGDMAQSVSSISTSILDDGEEIKALKDKLVNTELKYKVLECEMEKTNTRELQQANPEMSKLTPAFNEKELKLISQLMTRYYSKRKARSMTRSHTRDPEVCHSVTRFTRSARSASRRSSIRSRTELTLDLESLCSFHD